MGDTPLLEYAKSPPRGRKFRFGFLVGLGAAVITNIVPYAFTFRAYGTDGLEQIGFPFTFREQGGFVYQYMFSSRALVLDVAFCLCVGIAGGVIACIWKRFSAWDQR
jgi:hypothetical protein